MGILIRSFGHFIPDHIVSNKELAERFGITEEWIVKRTGIEERKYSLEGTVSDMIVNAAISCLNKTNVKPAEIDCIIVATMSPDYYCPSTASIVHQKLNTKNAFGFDIMAACSGYLCALQIASSLINSNAYNNILLCGADKFSSIIDPSDRKTVLIFADGAGVTLLQKSDDENDVLDTICKLNSEKVFDVITLVGGSSVPVNAENISEKDHYFRLKSKEVYENGIILMQTAILEILKKNKLIFDDIDYIIPHQANKRMIEELAYRLSVPSSKFIINVEKIGNTGAASIPIAISCAIENETLKGNEKLLLASVGAGFTYAASLIKLNL